MSNFINSNSEILLKVTYGCPFRYTFSRNVPCITTYQPALKELQFIAVCHSCQELPEERCKSPLHLRSRKPTALTLPSCIMIEQYSFKAILVCNHYGEKNTSLKKLHSSLVYSRFCWMQTE